MKVERWWALNLYQSIRAIRPLPRSSKGELNYVPQIRELKTQLSMFSPFHKKVSPGRDLI